MDSNPTDRSLMRRFRAGDDRAAGELHARYARRMRGLARERLGPAIMSRVDVDDIVQSALGSFFRAAREGMYQIPQGGELWQLLAAITRHKLSRARVHHMAAKRDVRRTMSDHEVSAASQSDDGQLVEILRLLIEEILESYNDVERRIIELRIENHDVAEIASRTSRSRRTVERVIHEFKHDLCKAYEAPPESDHDSLD